MRENILIYKCDEENPKVRDLMKVLNYFKTLYNDLENTPIGKDDDKIFSELIECCNYSKKNIIPLTKFQSNTLQIRECDNSLIDFNRKILIFKVKNGESNLRALLKHIRDAVAHSRIYIKKTKNNTFLVLMDYDKTNKVSAVIVITYSNLKKIQKKLKLIY